MNEAKVQKTMRLSADVIALVEKQKGNTFTEKFENLILNTHIKKDGLNAQIAEAEKMLKKISAQIQKYEKTEYSLSSISSYISYAVNTVKNAPVLGGDGIEAVRLEAGA